MAMNKKEQAEMDRLRGELLVAKAFRFTEPVEPDLMPPESYKDEDAVRGWGFNSHDEGRVYKAMTTSQSNTQDWTREDRLSWRQGAIRLYSTKLLALRALRNALEGIYARKLAEVDRRIEYEMKETT